MIELVVAVVLGLLTGAIAAVVLKIVVLRTLLNIVRAVLRLDD